MGILELARNGDINVLILFFIGSWLVVTPLALITAKIKNRLDFGVILLTLIPGVNFYALFFLMLMKASPKTA